MSFSLPAYLGTWFEVARRNSPFSADCTAARAVYSAAPGNTLSVVNTCYNAQGTGEAYPGRPELRASRSISGTATPTGPGAFSIRFAGVPVPGTYRVLWTDYVNFSIVAGAPGSGYLSVLSRRSVITEAERQRVYAKVEKHTTLQGLQVAPIF